MIITVTPFSITERVFLEDPMATLARGGRHIIQTRNGYDERHSFTVEASALHDACEEAWKRYQNIDEGRQTPDRGRSLMTGDMVRLVNDDADETWWICCSFGWEQTQAPGDERVEIGTPASI